MADIVYTYENTIYLNLTSSCPCQCVFCIRDKMDALGTAQELWHQKDPSWEEIKAAIDAYDWTGCKEVVFCGYGEPTCALDNLIRTAEYLRIKIPGVLLRLNTNGLSDLVNGKPTAKDLCQVLDSFSVSLNAPNAKRYCEVSKPIFGEKSFAAMLAFAQECKELGRSVKFSVVEDVITQEEIEQCQKLAADIGIPLRVRGLET